MSQKEVTLTGLYVGVQQKEDGWHVVLNLQGEDQLLSVPGLTCYDTEEHANAHAHKLLEELASAIGGHGCKPLQTDKPQPDKPRTLH